MLGKGDRETISQLGKYNVNVGEGTRLEIGDRVYVEWSDKAIQALTGAIQTLPLSGRHVEQTAEEEELEELDLDIQSIKLINSRLKAVEEIRKVGQLSAKQEKEFNTLKIQVQSLSRLNQELKETAKRTKTLLQEAVQFLEEKLEDIKSSKTELIGVSYQQDYNNQIKFIKSKIEIVKKFEIKLEVGREASAWLDKNIAQLAKSAGKRALNRCPEIKSNTSPEQIDDFYFSIEQFLEQVSHSLSLGRYNILDSPEIPLVFDSHVYEIGFSFIKEMLPSHLPKEIVEQIKDYINYLILRLSYY
ncbi:hypothetical protein H6F60_12690 [Coleofasciculus sp. FACHB-129]|nr:hypothetical protein [Coleofasciculus sp. FACHB-129]